LATFCNRLSVVKVLPGGDSALKAWVGPVMGKPLNLGVSLEVVSIAAVDMCVTESR